MTYYILLDMDSIEDIWDENILGEESFGKFYTGNGFKAFDQMVLECEKASDWTILESVAIMDEKGKSYSIDEFLKLIQKWKIILDKN